MKMLKRSRSTGKSHSRLGATGTLCGVIRTRHWLYTSPLLAATVLIGSLSLPIPAQAQQSQPQKQAQTQKSGKSEKADSKVIEEVIVNATRRAESAQDVPISLSVFNQKQLDDANISNPSDLAKYTPSLQANNRFGADNTTFAIRGFSQELRTTASVGVYFAEVVAPRGANAQQSGDGATPGDLFDLASVQVLKGPQGTLFGRNTTGGAVLLVPKKPTDVFEGYATVTHGNYNLWQEEAVLNLPIADSFKMRFGVQHKERNGYLHNFSGIGPEDFADSNVSSYRLSAIWDITDSIENYTILKRSTSGNNGYPGTVFACNVNAPKFAKIFGQICQNDLDARKASGNSGFYEVYNSVPKPVNKQTESQLINTTSWDLTDEITVKNIASYAMLETEQRTSLFGENWVGLDKSTPLIFQQVGLADGLPTTDQDSMVEELRIQGKSFDERLDWQAGLYYEKSRPGGRDSGSQSPAFISCDQSTISSSNPADFRCNNKLLSFGTLARTEGGVVYENQAAYAQATFSFNEMWSLTAGLRYTKDRTAGHVTETVWSFPYVTGDVYVPYGTGTSLFPPSLKYYDPNAVTTEYRHPSKKSEAPTWLIDVDYRPTDETMLYGKYTRGYRQGSVNIAGTAGYDTFNPEHVDTFEIGAKNTFEGLLPGTFNMAAFYNDFRNQQIQFGYFKTDNIGSTAIINAGKSVIWGMEANGNVQLPWNLILSGSYSHLISEVKSLNLAALNGLPTSSATSDISVTTAVGQPLSLAPKNQLVATLAWMVPIPVEMGDMKAAVTYVYTDKQQAVGKQYSILAVLPQYELWNLNFSWDGIFGSGFDVSAFITNLRNEQYITYINGTYNSGGIEGGAVGQPRMYGMRVRYNFGG